MLFEFTDENFAETTSAGVVLVHFLATWNGGDRAIAPTIEELADDYKERALVDKLDVDNNPEVTRKYGIRSIPTLLILRHGAVIHMQIGLTTKQVLANRLDAALPVLE